MKIRSGTARSGELDIVYEDMGNPGDPAVLLIMGLGAQLLLWRKGFCEKLVDQGLRVIRFDNRDVGLSSKLPHARSGAPLPTRMVRSFLGAKSPAGYTLEDMADDAAAVLDHLGLDRAHIVGASMGGMIAQIFAARHAARTRSLGIIFSSNNQAFLPPPGPKQLLALLSKPADASREAIIDNSVRLTRIIGSPGYPAPEETVRAHAAENFDRSYYPAGVGRHFAAILGSGSLRRYNRQATAPTVVIHGKADKLMRPTGGRAIARAIPEQGWCCSTVWAMSCLNRSGTTSSANSSPTSRLKHGPSGWGGVASPHKPVHRRPGGKQHRVAVGALMTGNKNNLVPHFSEVQAHYDLSDEFFALFLDPTRTYSCAFFERDDMTLEQAQLAKIDLALGKLGLQPGMTLLDIGCGWGATMARAVQHYDVDVVGLTLSENQQAHVAAEFARTPSPRDRRVYLTGWEEFDEPVDRIVSIGAFEHFGFERYDAFFQMARKALPDDGVMLLHTICGKPDQQVIGRGECRWTFAIRGGSSSSSSSSLPGRGLPTIEDGRGSTVREPASGARRQVAATALRRTAGRLGPGAGRPRHDEGRRDQSRRSTSATALSDGLGRRVPGRYIDSIQFT
jgi:pimeloyl-ACP methyl ester carboxylesterase/2-polyprenyl-3-methyl-5-hydroxy-6-metoxy-1,4-benzoquinol methylase